MIGIEWSFYALVFVKHGILRDTSPRLWEYKNKQIFCSWGKWMLCMYFKFNIMRRNYCVKYFHFISFKRCRDFTEGSGTSVWGVQRKLLELNPSLSLKGWVELARWRQKKYSRWRQKSIVGRGTKWVNAWSSAFEEL